MIVMGFFFNKINFILIFILFNGTYLSNQIKFYFNLLINTVNTYGICYEMKLRNRQISYLLVTIRKVACGMKKEMVCKGGRGVNSPFHTFLMVTGFKGCME